MEKKKQHILKDLKDWWKKLDSERKFLFIVIILVIAFIIFMPNIYKGFVKLREYDFHFSLFGKKDNLNNTTLTCSQSVKDNDYDTNITAVMSFDNHQLKKEDYKITLKAISDGGKKELSERKALYDASEEEYKKYKGFDVKSSLKGDTFSFRVITTYDQLDPSLYAERDENDMITVAVNFEPNQSIEEVKSFYEDLGLICKE